MENKPLERKLAQLPNGEKVVIEELDLKNNPETAVVRRIDGERCGTRAIVLSHDLNWPIWNFTNDPA